MDRKERNPPTATHPLPGSGLSAGTWTRTAGIVAGLAALLVLATVSGPHLLVGTAGAQGADTVTRSLPDRATCGETVEVTLAVDPPSGTDAWLVDENPPADASIGSIDGSHNGAVSDGHVKWVSTSGDAATLTYNVTVADDAADGTQLAFDGEYRFHDSMSSRAQIAGDDTLSVVCGSVERSLPAQAGCGDTVEVSLAVDAPESAEAWLVDETPPADASIGPIDESNNGAVSDGHVKWVSTDGSDAVVTYDVTVPADQADGSQLAFDGEHRLFPAMDERAPVEGDQALTVVCSTEASLADTHAFDLNADCVFSETELFSLIDDWKHSPADDAPRDDQLFEGIAHWKVLPDPYCTGG